MSNSVRDSTGVFWCDAAVGLWPFWGVMLFLFAVIAVMAIFAFGFIIGVKAKLP